MAKFIKPFRVGDVVKVKGDKIFDGINIIYEVSVNDVNDYEYATNRGAWIHHDNMKLIRKCDEKSMRQLLNDEEDEEESNYDES